MEQKKEQTWDERHPNGDVSHHTFINAFDGIDTLDEIETKIALRVLKHHLEQNLALEISDELFIAIFKIIPYLKPARPYGAYSVLGFLKPIQELLISHGMTNTMEKACIIKRFFGIGSNDKSFTISCRFNLE